jgi:demethylmenaquinone methyltransferase/2-methoxy-6-polyprenyl-1,4-benzoquinol methylase
LQVHGESVYDDERQYRDTTRAGPADVRVHRSTLRSGESHAQLRRGFCGENVPEIVGSWQPKKIVDLATGTGDLALALQRKLPAAEIVGVDFLPEMLELAKQKGVQQTIVADAMRLPFANSSFDCVTVAFGLRNMEEWGGALREMARVLRTTGHLLVLEFSLPRLSILRGFYRFIVLDRQLLGSFLTRQQKA